MTDAHFVRATDAPKLPPPPNTVGPTAWIMEHLFPTPLSSLATVLLGAFLLLVFWTVFDWAVVTAIWTGGDRESCVVEGAGACWPFVKAKFAQWIYGFYPIDQRWRVNLCFLVGLVALVPMLMPSVPYKTWNAIFLLAVYPLMTLILLTGGNFEFAWASYWSMAALILAGAALVPVAVLGLEEGIARNKPGLSLIGAAVVLWLLSFFIETPFASSFAYALLLAGAIYSLWIAEQAGGRMAVLAWLGALALVILTMLLLDIDFGLTPVETSQWGGLTVTLVVSVTGIVASLPLGILLALGRRSTMPIVKLLSVVFIEMVRGMPLVAVLFMASNMLPLFMPPGTSFDKLLRALVGVALFSAAYMAEVVRGGLQAIPKGQYEAANALGLSYWRTMGLIILPQALKIVIPGIVNTFIGLFKDTTLVSYIGLFDLLGIVQAGFNDAKWASPQTGNTGYFALAVIYWAFCFGMSRYSIYTERRLHTGHKR
jgi:general L-amino acid transport system permease protein